jgi:hypothetical protein
VGVAAGREGGRVTFNYQLGLYPVEGGRKLGGRVLGQHKAEVLDVGSLEGAMQGELGNEGNLFVG